MAYKNVRGTRDFYPEDMNARNKIFDSLKLTAKRFGFQEVDPPVIESLDLLKAKQGEEIISQLFTIEKSEELALRAEFTPSLARMFIEKQKSIAKPVKWFSLGKLFRYERPQAGRQREFFQFNVELYGSKEVSSDAEVINLAVSSLNNLGLKEEDFKVRVNNRKLMQGILTEIGTTDEVLKIIDKKEKISEEDFKSELKSFNLDDNQIKKLTDFFNKNIEEIKTENPLAKKGLEELKTLFKYTNTIFDPTIVRGLAYYTGMVFEIFDTEKKFRSIAGGGRYEGMISLFGGEETPAVGFGIGYSTLSLLLDYKELTPKTDNRLDYYIAVAGEDSRQKATEICQNLRKKYNVDIDMMRRKLNKQLDFANKIAAKKVIVIGSKELEENLVKVKDMATGDETKISPEEL